MTRARPKRAQANERPRPAPKAEHASRRAVAVRPERAPPRSPREASRAGQLERSSPLDVLYGLHSGLAVFARRPEDIRSISFSGAVRSELRELLDWAASAGVQANEEHEKELARRADSPQHEGLVLSVTPRRWLAAKELAGWLVSRRLNAVALDRVRNPQNIGAILRSAAFFGFGSAILGAPAPHPGLPPHAIRVAEGGAEHLTFARTTDLADTLARLRASGVHVIGTDIDAAVDVRDVPRRRPSVVVLGHEREGLGPRIRAQCDVLVAIRGSGAVQSLNVAVAAGILFAALAADRGPIG